MKQVYYFVFLAVLALTSAATKADTPVKIKVDDAARVTVKVNYAPVAVVTGTNTVNVPQYGSVQIEARLGFYLKSVTKTTSAGDATQQTITGLTSCSLYISESDRNAMFTVKSGDLEAARTGSCTVTVDHAAKVKMMRYESQTAVDLTDGDNTVKWIPGTEKTLVISNRNYGEAPIYKVTVDGQDNITVNGQSSFKVYVDGKPNVMFSASPSQIFKSMPASAVKSIEVVTNPGAKYDAEGVGGVLNIVMNHADGQGKMKMNGYNGNVSLIASSKGWRTSGFLSGQQGKLTYSANVMYSKALINGTVTEINRTSADGSRMDYWQEGHTRIPFTMNSISLGYELDSMSNIGASVGLTSFSMKNDGHPLTRFSGGPYGAAGFSYGNEMTMENTNTSFNGSVDYQRFFNKERTSSLMLSYLFTTSPAENDTRRVYDPIPGNVTIPLHDLYSEAKTRGTEHTVQADFTTPLGKGQTLNAGLKFISRRNSSDSKYYDITGGNEVYNAANSVNYKNTQNILAEYA